MTIIGTPYRICSDVARVPMPVGAPVVLCDDCAHLTDDDACTMVTVEPDAWEADGAAALTDTVGADWDGWGPAEPGRTRGETETQVCGPDLRAVLRREGPCVVVRLPVETWDDGDALDPLPCTVLAVRPLTVDAARRYVLDSGERGAVLCSRCAVRVEAGEDVPGLGAASPVARACSTTDGVCDACGAEAEGPWDGYGLYAHVIA